jgi:hypothetical protein
MKKVILFCISLLLIAVPAMADSTATGISSQGQHQAIEIQASRQIRALPLAPTPPVVRGPALFGGPDYTNAGPNFMSMEALVKVLNKVDLASANVSDEDDLEVVAQVLEMLASANDPCNPDPIPSSMDFRLMDSEFDAAFIPVAAVSIRSTGQHVNSASLAVALAKKAKELGCSKVVFMREGFTKRLTAFGWSVGLSAVTARVHSDATDSGSVGAAGIGIGGGKSEFITLPYLTALIGN